MRALLIGLVIGTAGMVGCGGSQSEPSTARVDLMDGVPMLSIDGSASQPVDNQIEYINSDGEEQDLSSGTVSAQALCCKAVVVRNKIVLYDCVRC